MAFGALQVKDMESYGSLQQRAVLLPILDESHSAHLAACERVS